MKLVQGFIKKFKAAIQRCCAKIKKKTPELKSAKTLSKFVSKFCILVHKNC